MKTFQICYPNPIKELDGRITGWIKGENIADAIRQDLRCDDEEEKRRFEEDEAYRNAEVLKAINGLYSFREIAPNAYEPDADSEYMDRGY